MGFEGLSSHEFDGMIASSDTAIRYDTRRF